MLFIPQREFLRFHRVGPLGLNGFLHLGVLFGIFHFTPTNRGLYSPKERFLKEPLRGVPFVWVLSFLYLIDFKILPPNDKLFDVLLCGWGLGVVWVWCGVGRIYLSEKKLGEKLRYFFSFFLMSLAIRGNDFKFFPGPNKAILELKNRKWFQKLTIFGQIDIRVLAILGVQKVWEKTRIFFIFFLKCL